MFPTISNCSVTTIVSAVLEPCFQLCFRSCCVICRNSLAVHAGLLTEPPTLPTISGVSQQHSVYNSSEAIVRFDCGNRFANRPVLSGCSFCLFSPPSCLVLLHPPLVSPDRITWVIWRSWLWWLQLSATTWTTEELTTPTSRGAVGEHYSYDYICMIAYACVGVSTLCFF